MKRRMIALDVDGTLAVSKSPLSEVMAAHIRALLGVFDVCVISGGRFAQFEEQVISRLSADRDQLRRFI